ncbi:MAG: response regulator [Candidatus Aminicenantes bacterium]|nr:response regulator [Candidatus Aminicenantes bacterium]NIM81827.1 response regulator [Candidatus Aminicenantes bacterium]NIN21200.1 response regulator [Candidatus Aminicenantes bacterium]NIN45024.1 response regulator [Candidatus Aminicenantes bacterium]NIN87842.1 response regulator [Candidatus Aminicenantes bacterium]
MAKQTILIVEDDKKVIELIKAAIEKIGIEYIIKIAYNGEQALYIIEKDKIDLALLDIHMPVMSGAQLLTELCNRKIWFPIIIITAYSVNNIHHKLLEYGIIDLLGKPLNMVNLKEKIEAVLKKRKHKDSISGLSLEAIMQVLEMERRTGVMTIKIENRNVRIFFNNGKVVDIEAVEASREEALVDFLDQSIENKEISIEYLNHRRKEKIYKSFTQVLLETSKLLDEKKKKKLEPQKDTIEPEIGKQHRELEKEVKTDHRPFNYLVESLKKELGDALFSTAIWALPGGRMVAGYNSREGVCHVFTQITYVVHEALIKAKYPDLGNYIIFDLKDGKMSVTIPLGVYSWGMLIDSRKIPPEFLLKEILPKRIAAFKEAITS